MKTPTVTKVVLAVILSMVILVVFFSALRAERQIKRIPAESQQQAAKPVEKTTPCKANEWVDDVDLTHYVVDFPTGIDFMVKVNGVEQKFRMPAGPGTYKFPLDWRVISVKFPFDFPLKQVPK